ncbi:hypothetical protein BKA70DRAFT_1329049 [Coprinopsis sp. MPI-PUGE-AT-0042]|nr:hypothetical protein BKA70DRAFT_1329049 [Coprinopsis sp. MPI-PUGE-AT-0042]
MWKQYPIVAASVHHVSGWEVYNGNASHLFLNLIVFPSNPFQPSPCPITQNTIPMPDSTTPAFIFTVRQLSTLTDEDLENASETLSLAFNNDQFTRVITGHDDDFYEEFLTSTLTASSLCGGEIYVAETREKQVIGVAMWFGPGRALHLGSSPEESGQEAGIFASDMEPELREWWESEFMPKHKRLSDAGLGPGTKLANWNLQIIATHPNYLRQGVCRTMIEIVERKVDSPCPSLACSIPLTFRLGSSRWVPHVYGGADRGQRCSRAFAVRRRGWCFPNVDHEKETKRIAGDASCAIAILLVRFAR